MNLAIFGESGVDEVVLRILVDGLLKGPASPTPLPRLKSRGWPAVLRNLPAVIKSLHYQRAADALIVIADSNNRPVHAPSHVPGAEEKCRHCLLEHCAANTLRQLSPVGGREAVKVAIAIPCPSMEAWLLCHDDSLCSEASWVQRSAATNSFGEIKRLKKRLYGLESPHSDEKMQSIACERARAIAADPDRLAKAFPNSFGLLAAALKKW